MTRISSRLDICESAVENAKELAEKLNVPCMIIDQMDYAYGNAKSIYLKIQKVLENKKG